MNVKRKKPKAMYKKYCAIVKNESDYLLAAIQKSTHQVIFETFAVGTLKTLAVSHQDFLATIAIEMMNIQNKSWFFPNNFSDYKIYQAIKKHYKNYYVDFEKIKSEGEEILVISYAMPIAHYTKIYHLYRDAGFQLGAIEPLESVKKRPLQHSWQHDALKSFNYSREIQEISLKLLDRENFYGA